MWCMVNQLLKMLSYPRYPCLNISTQSQQELCECCLTENGTIATLELQQRLLEIVLFIFSCNYMHCTESPLKTWKNVRKTKPVNIHLSFVNNHLIFICSWVILERCGAFLSVIHNYQLPFYFFFFCPLSLQAYYCLTVALYNIRALHANFDVAEWITLPLISAWTEQPSSNGKKFLASGCFSPACFA